MVHTFGKAAGERTGKRPSRFPLLLGRASGSAFAPLVRNEVPDLAFGFRPNPAPAPKAFNQTPVANGKQPEPEGRHARIGQKTLNVSDQRLLHGATIARLSVQVNTRYNVQASEIGAW